MTTRAVTPTTQFVDHVTAGTWDCVELDKHPDLERLIAFWEACKRTDTDTVAAAKKMVCDVWRLIAE